MKRTIRHLLAFTALAAIAACAATPPSLVVKDLNNVPGDTPIWMNFVQCWEYILENGGGGREYANAVAISATNYTDKATNALAASTATALGAYLPLSGGDMTGDMTFQPNNSLIWGGDYDNHDAYLMAGSPGLIVYNDANEKWVFKSSVIPETDDDVLRRRDLSAVATAATNYTDESISADNPAFASAVRSVPITGAAESDLAEIAEYGSYGTVGAAILALIAGLAALKRGKLDAVDVRYIINPVAVSKTLPDEAVVYDANGNEVSDWHIDYNSNMWVLYSAADGQEEPRMYWNADGSPSSFSTPGSGWSIVVGSTTYSESTSPILPMLVEICALADRAVNCLSVSSDTSINFKLPASPDAEGATPKHVRDFILDIDNSENTSQSLTVNFDYLGTDFALTCDSSTSVAALCSIAGNTRVRLHFKETGLTVLNNLPVFFMERVTLGSFVTNT